MKYMLNKLHKNALHKRSSGPKLITVEVSYQPFRLVHSFTGRILVYTTAGRILDIALRFLLLNLTLFIDIF